MNKQIEKLDNIQFILNQLVNDVKHNTIQNNIINNDNIEILDKNIKKINDDNNAHFFTNYNITRIKEIFVNLVDIIKQQDKRILKLESTINHNES
jgi:hypothetical protein